MNTNQRIIKNTQIQLNTNFPLYSENYDYPYPSNDDSFHSHEFFEIGITLDGGVIHKTTDGDYPLKRGQVYLIPIGQSHSISIPKSWNVQNIYFLPRLIFQSLNMTYFLNPGFNQFLLNLIQRDLESTLYLQLSESSLVTIEHLLTTYNHNCLTHKQLLENYQNNCLINVLLILCESYYTKYTQEILNCDPRIPIILGLIQENIHIPTSALINLIQSKLALHPQYINKLVKNTLNITLSTLIIETKIEKSCAYLLNDYSITETAHALSFYDHAHYNKYFTKYFGIMPSQYRKKYTSQK